ncbi:MAG: hypothetical protein KJS97_07510 [Alphaproteobacteria bacterium]|nr:hypothetical protein [Alphaproteobacteria bacterium]
MPLPVDQTLIDDGKLRYLLDAEHPQNAGKAAFFNQHGFSTDRLDELAAALRSHLENGADAIAGPHGIRLVCDAPLPSPDGRAPWVRSVWQIDVGSARPRFITAYPLRRRP